jgi:hypothetical protein
VLQATENVTQIIGGSLHEFISTIKQLTYHAFPALHKDHVHRGSCRAFDSGIRDQYIKQQLLLGDEKTLDESLGQNLELDIVSLAVWPCVRLCRTGERALCRIRPLPNERRD